MTVPDLTLAIGALLFVYSFVLYPVVLRVLVSARRAQLFKTLDQQELPHVAL